MPIDVMMVVEVAMVSRTVGVMTMRFCIGFRLEPVLHVQALGSSPTTTALPKTPTGRGSASGRTSPAATWTREPDPRDRSGKGFRHG
jgi:hypothetical protein